ncbi:ParB N-terminal domain-containing protein [Pyramidobacter piscolens]|uniref:ParB N-terminal domain-containing protein n=1 Tax=Pyramidobacter piscolens TaxID=638849 RepID=UPI002AAFDFC0|nr:ParB N-terminal domain-containing protein [Pyramidobacter piscolens]
MTENAMIAIEKLRLDPLNPRLPTNYQNARQEDVLRFMLEDEGILELMKSIAESGYFASEPLLVAPYGDGDYVVVEGNRRLTALKLLKDPAQAPIRQRSIQEICDSMQAPLPEFVPAIVYSSREEILECLGYRHITGIKSWGALEKARYLKQLYLLEAARKVKGKDIFKSLAQKIGSNPATVRRLICGYALYEVAAGHDYFEIPNELAEDRIDFSLLTTAISYSKIRDFLGLPTTLGMDLPDVDEGKMRELFHWIYKQDAHGRTQLGESRNLKNLAEVISTPEALKVFRASKNLETAILYTGALDEKFTDLLNKAEMSLSECKTMMELLHAPNKENLETLNRIQRSSKSIEAGLKAIYFDGSEND